MTPLCFDCNAKVFVLVKKQLKAVTLLLLGGHVLDCSTIFITCQGLNRDHFLVSVFG